MWHDLRYSFRQVLKNKSFTSVVILLLGVGLGTTALIFGFFNTLILKTLPIRDSDNFYLMEKMRTKQVRPETASSYYVYNVIRSRTDLFSSAIAIEDWTDDTFQSLDAQGETKIVSTEIVSPNYFSDLGAKTILGRTLTEADAKLTSDIPIVLSYEFWSRRLNQDSGVVGRILRIKNYQFRVVGVLSKAFHGVDIDRSPDVRLPITAASIFTGRPLLEPRLQFQVFVRLAPGVNSAKAADSISHTMKEADATTIRAMFAQQGKPKPGALGADQKPPTFSKIQIDEIIQSTTAYKPRLHEMSMGQSRMREQFTTALRVLMGAAALLLTAVCASIAGLLLAKTERRRREIAIAIAIGASRGRLLRQLFLETLLWAIPGTLLALLFAQIFWPVLIRLLPEVRGFVPLYATQQVLNVSLDQRSILFLLVGCLVATLLSAAGSAWRLLRVDRDLNDSLKIGQSRHKSVTGVLIVGMQVALCVVLVAGAGLIFKTFWKLQHLNPGFDRAHVIEVDLDPSLAGYSALQTRQYLEEMRRQLASLPEVRSVGSALTGVMHGVGMKFTVVPEGATLPDNAFANTNINLITPDYFNALGVPLLSGRFLEERDRNIKPDPTVVNSAFANTFFPGQNPIGRRLSIAANGKATPSMIVVGVVGTAKYRSLREEDPPILYTSENEKSGDRLLGKIFYIRTTGKPDGLIPEITKVIRRRDARVPIVAIATLEQQVQSSLWQERLLTLLLGFFGVAALGLAAAGIYGALAYAVATQSREIGIRLAIGAKALDITRFVCGPLFVAVSIGLLGGIVGAMLLMKITRQIYFDPQFADPSTFLISLLCVLVFSFAAALPPVLRAIGLDPVIVMRTE